MSCFICKKETISLVTLAISRMYYSGRLADVPGANIDVLDAYKDNKGNLDQHKLYSAVYIANLKAYNGRYNENVKEYEKYTGIPVYLDADGKKTLDALRQYLYQIEEHPVYGTPFYWLVYSVTREIGYLVAAGCYGTYLISSTEGFKK